MYGKGGKNAWVLFLLMLAGIVLGGFIGHYLGQLPYLTWISYGKDFGIGPESPLTLDLEVIRLQFSLLIRFNITGLLGMVVAVICYRRL